MRLRARVAASIEDRGPGKPSACSGCGAALSEGQRYCLDCGARRGPLPTVVARRVEALRRKKAQPAAGEGRAKPESSEAEPEEDEGYWRFMPSPQVAAVAVMALLAAGVVIGSVTSPFAASAGVSPILFEQAAVPASEPEPVEEPEVTTSPEPEPVSEPVLAAAPPPALPPAEEPTAPPPKTTLPPEEFTTAELPPVKHVFLIVLGDMGYEAAFGETSTAPYLSRALPKKGELLSNYYGVAQGALANEVALLSGQGPTPETALNCPNYADLAPGTVSASGQVEGNGCVYPSSTLTLPGQLATAGQQWKAYVEDIANGGAEQSSTCRHPALGAADPNQAPLPGDAYETWRNPFVYFHALTDGTECAERDVGLEQLQVDLRKKGKAPALAYIVPDACHNGSEAPCEAEAPAGPAAADAFLEEVVPQIMESQAYKEGGLIAITSAQAPQAGPNADQSSCCATPEYPNLPPQPPLGEEASGPVKASGGGGRLGLLLISPFVAAGTTNESGYYNHYSLLLSIEELFGLTPLGYAAEPALTAFDETVYNAGQ